MTIDLDSFKRGIVMWCNHAVPKCGVMWQGQKQAQLPFPYIALLLRRTYAAGYPADVQRDFNPLAPNGQEIVTTYSERQEVSIQIDVYTTERQYPNDAVSIGEELLGSLRGSFVKSILKDIGKTQFRRRNQGQTIPDLQGETHIQRFSCDIFFEVISTYVEKCGYIETVIVNGTTSEPTSEINQVIVLDTD